MMTGNRFLDVVPSTLRLMLQRRSHVPDPLYGVWRLLWCLVGLTAVLGGVWLVGKSHLPHCIQAALGSAVILVPLSVAVTAIRGFITSYFVDVVRYLDTSPRSYEARRNIRGGLVDLLAAMHAENRYARIVVVAHSLGAYIAYDGLSSLWADMHELHAGPPGAGHGRDHPVQGLEALEEAADKLLHPDASRNTSTPTPPPENDPEKSPLEQFREDQFALWQGLRRQGNPWRVTDFVSVGTPMYLADLLCTHPKLWSGLSSSHRTAARRQFDAMMAGGELVQCPPRSETLPVEAQPPADPSDPPIPRYSWNFQRWQVLGSQSLFAVVRWTNLWFPVPKRGSLRGDWFGGPLHDLFGPGILDIPVLGNKPGRLGLWAKPHTRYFNYPCDDGPDDIATLIRDTENLGLYTELLALQGVTGPDPHAGGARLSPTPGTSDLSWATPTITRQQTLDPIETAPSITGDGA